jgi:Na+:H+ antiporter, NhaB family
VHKIHAHGRVTPHTFFENFLGDAPQWYKMLMIGWLLANPVILLFFGPFVTGWVILLEFIVTLALALKAYPLLTGGLLLLEALVLQLVPPDAVHEEIAHNLSILFLVLFVVTAVHFFKGFLSRLFIKTILVIRSDILLSQFFLILGTVLSALLDALTVMAVVIAVLSTLFAAYHRYESAKGQEDDHDLTNDMHVKEHRREALATFRAVLCKLVMYAAIGSMLGGISTLIGEPQNLLIGEVMGWHFNEFFTIMLPVSLPVFLSGVVVCFVLEKFRLFDYGTPLSEEVRGILAAEAAALAARHTTQDKGKLIVQAFCAMILVAFLVLHVSEVYVIGLIILILVTSFTGTSEHGVANGIKEGGAFVFVLAVFFGIVAMIHAQHLFTPVSEWVLGFTGSARLMAYYAATGILSAISDNVFVASLFITEAQTLQEAGAFVGDEYKNVAVAINMGTNIPSIATPNGQAAFLFLLMSPLAPLIRLSYGKMFLLALPFAVVCTAVGAGAIYLFY